MSDIASPAIAEADRLDAAGDHDNAINALARATQAGDLAAMTALGKRLVVGDRAPSMPREGASFLLEATQKGCAEAPARLAVLLATGFHCRQDWPQAMELLMTAAERGFAAARAQLVTLAGETDASGASDHDPGRWRRLGARIDVASYFRAPPVKVLSDSPVIRAYERLVSDAVCNWLIERAKPRLGPALVYDPVAREDIQDAHRSNTAASFNLIDTDLVLLLVQHRMSASCGVPLENMETLSVLHYAVGEEIKNHFDFVDPKTPNYRQEIADRGQRIVTFLLYLNDDYDGGETDFPRLGITHKGRRGDGLYFGNALPTREPDLRMIHAGRPPLRGEKWVVSQFIRDRAMLRRNG